MDRGAAAGAENRFDADPQFHGRDGRRVASGHDDRSFLAGLPPLEAAKYQIMIMFLLAGATAFGVVIAGVGSVLLL